MKFILQFLGNLTCFFLYSIIGLQLANPGFMDFSGIETISWLDLLQTILFFIIVSVLSILTTHAFSYTFQRRKGQQIPTGKVEGSEISPEITVEETENQPDRIIDILTDTTDKVIREDEKTGKSPKHHKKKAAKKKISKPKK